MKSKRLWLALGLSCSIGSSLAGPITPGSNTVLFDSFEGSTTGTAFGTLNFVSGQLGFGQAAQFGAGDFVRYSLGSMSQGTIELWIKPDVALSTTHSGFLDINWYNTTSHPGSGHILHFGANTGAVGVSAWPGGNVIGSTPLTSSGGWLHVAASWGPAGTKVYLDGVLDGSSPSALNVSFQSTNYLYLNYWGDTNFSGLMDDLQVSNIQLSDAMIANHAAAPIPEPETYVMLLAGLGLLGFVARRRKQKEAALA